jgi:hypothetical protein
LFSLDDEGDPDEPAALPDGAAPARAFACAPAGAAASVRPKQAAAAAARSR